jgi:uncharacterized protein (TIGR02246 family)
MRGRSGRFRGIGELVMLVLCMTSVDPRTAVEASSPRAADDAALRALMAQMVEAWDRGDSAGLAAAFTEDGELVAGDGTLTSGRREIERYFAGLLTKQPKGTMFVAPVTSVRLLTTDVALVSSGGGFLLPGDTEVSPERRGIQFLVAVRDGGTWRAALFQRTRIPPPPSANATR